MSGSTEVRCPLCGAIALCSPSKGVWCPTCKNGKDSSGHVGAGCPSVKERACEREYGENASAAG